MTLLGLLSTSPVLDLLHQLISITILLLQFSLLHDLLGYDPSQSFFLDPLVYQTFLQVVAFAEGTDEVLLSTVLVAHQHVVVLGQKESTFLYDISFIL